MDTKKLPLSMLVALGLAPGCGEIGCTTRPCLNIAEPPPKTPPDDAKKTPPEDEKKTRPDPEMTPCLSPPEPPPDPEMTPCLSPPEPDPPPTPKKSGGMARSDVLDRVENVLPPDVASRLRGRA